MSDCHRCNTLDDVTYQRVVTTKSDSKLSLARVLIDALEQFLVDLVGADSCQLKWRYEYRRFERLAFDTRRGFLSLPMSGSGVPSLTSEVERASAPLKSTS